MNNKEEVIEDFFRSFKVALTNSFSYSKDHPYFIKSVENFKSKLESTLISLNPLKIGVTNLALVVDGKNLTKVGFYDELARLFHQRKIKSIEIRDNATIAELIGFFSVISMSPKDIFKNGGVNSILKKQQSPHLIIEELDYSAFLEEAGQECTDIWSYMLKEAVRSNNTYELNRAADDFGNFIKRSAEQDIIGNDEALANIGEFLSSLKEKGSEKFSKCSKETFQWLLHHRKSLGGDKIEKFKPVFKDLSNEDLSAILWEGLTHEDDFDALSLQLFSKISEQKDQPKIAEGLLNQAGQSQQLTENPHLAKKIQDLVKTSQNDQASAVYRNILESLIKNVSSSGVLSFDQETLKENYRYIILSMLSIEKEEDSLKLVSQMIEKEFVPAFESNDNAFLKDLYDQLVKSKKEGVGACIELENKFSAFVENIIFNKSLSFEQEFLTEMISQSAYDLNYYLDKIFNYGKINKQVLTLFFKLFPGNLGIFHERLSQKLQDMEFLSNLVKALSQFDIPESLELLEHIYSSANELIKLDALNVMRRLKKADTAFLIQQLNTDSFALRKAIYSVLMLDPQAKGTVLNLLFKIPSPFGTKNKFLIENMQIVYELGFTEAAEGIRDLSGKRFFWNIQLRNKAKQILKEWNVL
ncbi:MAG: hypothetical protein PHR84_04075 [Candidatus Omnitrophica bacterium]|nr:hypothetical protein [Candidatus Omnitrophota bacterium]MDD5660828.1 hypothetical protein [Candidatus Omnitrophota bacterium]